MAVKLPLRERAKIRLGDFNFSELDIRRMMAKIAMEDAMEKHGGRAGFAAGMEPEEEAPEPEQGPVKRRRRGRPSKHKESGKQFSVWLPETVKRLLVYHASCEGISAGELAARLIENGLTEK